jgi:hypothetical protein
MKLFTSAIDKQLFAQYPKGANLENQKVVAKIFNPYGNGRWFLLNSDANDPNYLLAIVEMGGNVEIGSVSRRELETLRVGKYRFPLERDLGFSAMNANELYMGVKSGKYYESGGYMAEGGDVEEEPKVVRGYFEDEEYEYAEGGVVDANVFDKLKKGDKIKVTFGDAIKRSNEKELMVKSKTTVGKGKTWESEKITFVNLDNPNGVNYFAYKRGSGFVSFAMGDMAISNVKIKGSYSDGGYMENGGEFGVDKHKVYFSSLAEVIEAIYNISEDNGYNVVDIFPDLTYGGISYGQTKKVKVELEWNGKEKRGKSKKRDNNVMNVSIYRMDSGNYELNTYFAYANGGYMAKGGSISKFNPMELIGRTFWSKHNYGEIVDVRVLSEDNIKVKYETSKGTYSVEKSFTKKELFDMSNGKVINGDEILKMAKGGYMAKG